MKKETICRLAKLCQDSYKDKADFVLRIINVFGQDELDVRFVSVDEADVFIINNHTETSSYVVIRGTESEGYGLIRDWLRNLCSLIPYPSAKGIYPLGFYFGFQKIRGQVQEAILYPYNIQVTGHSQGAAIAGIALSEWLGTGFEPAAGALVAPPLMLGLFNSARVSETYGKNLVKVENNTDIVTYLGIPVLFYKPGNLVYIDSNNKAHYDVPNRSWMIADKLKGLVAALAPSMLRTTLGVGQVVLDHDIEDYVDSLCTGET